MIFFRTDKGCFNYRSAAVIVHDDQVLLHRSIDDDFWALPGGRVEFMEQSDVAVTREILEELGLESRVVQQLWHVENFFEYNSEKYHEISNIYRVELANPPTIETELDFKGIEDSEKIYFRWVPLDKAVTYTIYPRFLISRLSDLPTKTEFIKVDETFV